MTCTAQTILFVCLNQEEMIGTCSVCGERRGVYSNLVEKYEGKWSFGKPRRRWEDNIKIDIHELGSSCGDWIEMAQDRDRWRHLRMR
jgi:hypothetical protein